MKQNVITETNEIIEVMPLNKILLEDTKLSLFQKTLLVTDGTVTDLLRLYTQKEISVDKIYENFCLSGRNEKEYCDEGTLLLNRKILLGHRNEKYVYADSNFIYGSMTKRCKYELLKNDTPIGLLWKEEKIHTYREIVKIRTEICDDLVSYFEVPLGTTFLARTYIVYSGEKTLGIVTEKFPITFFY